MLLGSRIAYYNNDIDTAHAKLQTARDHIERTGHLGLQPLMKRINNEFENY
jgi:hypothetical protein